MGGGGDFKVVSKSENMSFFFYIKFLIMGKQKSSYSGFWRHRVGGGAAIL